MTGLLHIVARNGRLCLVVGLLAGLALPGVAAALRPCLPALVAVLLFLTAFRVGPGAALGELALGRRTLGLVLVLQLVLPLAALAVLLPLGWAAAPFALAAVLMLAAPSVTGAPNFAIMTGQDPAPAMRLMVLGTALFPLTVLPVFWALPQLGGAEGLGAALRLVVVILGAVGAGLALRHLMDARVTPERLRALDGVTALALAVIVVGLMSAIGPLLRADPMVLLGWAAAVFALNIGLQVLAFLIYRDEGRAAVSIVAGNRNIALFLIALPDRVVEPLLIFIGCYQIPMYLTPLLMRPLHDRA
ncbi:MAG: hypothetical protein EP307_06520 [Rhodobacteraceae bacterium]|nr:MAG: hypothetical protein EP307_06520 [Paracoccaceae bacterium]